MMQLPQALEAWGTPGFDAAFKAELAKLGPALPLQEGLTAGSFAVEESIEVIILSSAETDTTLEVKVMIFYPSLTPGCACAGDPTVESEQTERVTALVTITRATAEAVVLRVDD